jgi:DNA-binding LacI/PurR family transcriptional regulator/DNA-binding transcriptional regulator YhcF (GntR family)
MKRSSRSRTLSELADALAGDIRTRRLRPGDPYLTTAEAARLLGVNAAKANRVLQLLAQRRVLVRRQRKGAFIAQPPSSLEEAVLDRIHLLVQRDYLKTEGVLADGTILGLQGVLPRANIQFNLLPGPDEEEDYLNGLIAEALRASRPQGFVLVRSSVQAQRLFQASGLPTVVYGSLLPSIQSMAQVERDQRQIGALLARYLIGKQCRRLAVLLRDHVGEGDHQLLDAVMEELAAADFELGALTIRCLPADWETVQASVVKLAALRPGPLGLICRSEPLARAAASATPHLMGRAKPRVVVCDVYRKDINEPPLPHIVMTPSPEEIGRWIAELLEQQARGRRPTPARRLIPVTLIDPEGGSIN